MARPSLHGSIYGVSGEGMTHPGGSYMADSLTNNSVPVVGIKIFQNTGRLEQAFPGIGVFKIGHLNPLVHLEKRIPLATGNRRIRPRLDALLRWPDLCPVLLPEVVQGIRNFQLAQPLTHQT